MLMTSVCDAVSLLIVFTYFNSVKDLQLSFGPGLSLCKVGLDDGQSLASLVLTPGTAAVVRLF